MRENKYKFNNLTFWAFLNSFSCSLVLSLLHMILKNNCFTNLVLGIATTSKFQKRNNASQKNSTITKKSLRSNKVPVSEQREKKRFWTQFVKVTCTSWFEGFEFYRYSYHDAIGHSRCAFNPGVTIVEYLQKVVGFKSFRSMYELSII